MNELTLNETLLKSSEIPEILGNGIRIYEVETLNFDNFLKEFSI